VFRGTTHSSIYAKKLKTLTFEDEVLEQNIKTEPVEKPMSI